MKKPNHNLTLPVGNVSLDKKLGKFYQDFSQALDHFENNYFGDTDKKGLPMHGFGDDAVYHQIFIIQLGIISHDLVLDGIEVDKNTKQLTNCIEWLENHCEEYKGTSVWRNDFPLLRYGLDKGWVSAMYQGQIMSLYLRYGQLINEEEKYIAKAQLVYDFLAIDFKDGGVRRVDQNDLLWFEEYPSKNPSFVMNGFVYTLLGLYDLWRITKDAELKLTIDSCVKTLKESIHLYDSGYWSIYDQSKKELATRYYHKNIHIPLMEVLHNLTGEEIFDFYNKRWKKQLNSKFSGIWVSIMYRIQPRLRRLIK